MGLGCFEGDNGNPGMVVDEDFGEVKSVELDATGKLEKGDFLLRLCEAVDGNNYGNVYGALNKESKIRRVRHLPKMRFVKSPIWQGKLCFTAPINVDECGHESSTDNSSKARHRGLAQLHFSLSGFHVGPTYRPRFRSLV